MKNNPKIVFLGTPEFAIPSLEALVKAKHQIIGVITATDKPVGRKQILTPPPVKIAAQKFGLPVYQPKDKTELLEVIKNLQPDLAIVAAFGMILPREILEISKYGFINVHPSLLPKYRGATPIQTAILNGDKETGVSLFLIDEKVDHGKIISNLKSSTFANASAGRQISNLDTYEILMRKLAKLGADLIIEFLRKYENMQKYEKIEGAPQDESQATYTKKFSTQDAYIEPLDLEKAEQNGGQLAIEIDRKIRALNPEPGVWTIQNGKRMKILEAELTSENKLKLKKIQFEGKNPISYN